MWQDAKSTLLTPVAAVVSFGAVFTSIDTALHATEQGLRVRALVALCVILVVVVSMVLIKLPEVISLLRKTAFVPRRIPNPLDLLHDPEVAKKHIAKRHMPLVSNEGLAPLVALATILSNQGRYDSLFRERCFQAWCNRLNLFLRKWDLPEAGGLPNPELCEQISTALSTCLSELDRNDGSSRRRAGLAISVLHSLLMRIAAICEVQPDNPTCVEFFRSLSQRMLSDIARHLPRMDQTHPDLKSSLNRILSATLALEDDEIRRESSASIVNMGELIWPHPDIGFDVWATSMQRMLEVGPLPDHDDTRFLTMGLWRTIQFLRAFALSDHRSGVETEEQRILHGIVRDRVLLLLSRCERDLGKQLEHPVGDGVRHMQVACQALGVYLPRELRSDHVEETLSRVVARANSLLGASGPDLERSRAVEDAQSQ